MTITAAIMVDYEKTMRMMTTMLITIAVIMATVVVMGTEVVTIMMSMTTMVMQVLIAIAMIMMIMTLKMIRMKQGKATIQGWTTTCHRLREIVPCLLNTSSI